MNDQRGEVGGSALSQRVTLECVDASDSGQRLDAELGYDAHDPYAITLTFSVPGENVVWRFGRELLESGLDEPSGDGDVHLWPCLDPQGRAVVLIELCSPDGELLTQVRARDIQRFLLRSHAVVPSGRESGFLDLDHLVDALLGEAA